MNSLDEGIQTLFDRYLTAWNARDFDAVATCYAEPSFFVLPQASVPVSDKAAMISLLEQIFTGLEADNFSHTEIGAIEARSCEKDIAIVDAKDVKRLRKDGSVLEAIDAHYVARRKDGKWLFTTAVVCAPGWQDQ